MKRYSAVWYDIAVLAKGVEPGSWVHTQCYQASLRVNGLSYLLVEDDGCAPETL